MTMIRFSELRACFYQDPVQLYIRHYVGVPPVACTTVSNAYKSLVEWYYSNHKKYDVRDATSNNSTTTPVSRSVYEDSTNYFKPVLLDREHNVEVPADLLLTQDVLQKEFGVTIPRHWKDGTSVLVAFVSHPVVSPYQKYKMHACISAVRHMPPREHSINRNIIIQYSPSTQKAVIRHYSEIASDRASPREDTPIAEMYTRFVQWRNDVGDGMSFPDFLKSPRTRAFIYPNMKYMDELDDEAVEWKTRWAMSLHEITLLPGMYPHHRKVCSSMKDLYRAHRGHHLEEILDAMNIRKPQRPVIKKMLELRYGDEEHDTPQPPVFIGSVDMLSNTCLSWKHDATYLFVDFETLEDTGKIYMIGIASWNQRDGLVYDCMMADSDTPQDLRELMTRFIEYLDHGTPFPIDRIFYWYAETVFLKQAAHSQHRAAEISAILNKFEWVDLCSEMRSNPVVLRDCFTYKLKHVWKAMTSHGLIDTPGPPGECCNGGQSIEIAKRYFRSRSPDLLKLLKTYNEFDCRVMHDILVALGRFVVVSSS